jgi:hypothetical protein
MGTANQEWDGYDRRHTTGWDRYEVKVLSDIKNIQEEVGSIKKDMSNMQIAFAEMKMEVKQIVSASATKTSSVVSTIITTVGGIIVYVLTGMKG